MLEKTYFAINPEFCHRVYYAQEGRNCFGLLANLGLVQFECKIVVLEICFNLLAVDIVNVQICDGQDTAPVLVAVRKLRTVFVENAIKEGEVIRDLLVTLYVEAVLGLRNGSSEVRHPEF